MTKSPRCSPLDEAVRLLSYVSKALLQRMHPGSLHPKDLYHLPIPAVDPQGVAQEPEYEGASAFDVLRNY